MWSVARLLQVYIGGEGRNSSASAELQSVEQIMHEEAEHKAAYAGMPLSSLSVCTQCMTVIVPNALQTLYWHAPVFI